MLMYDEEFPLKQELARLRRELGITAKEDE